MTNLCDTCEHCKNNYCKEWKMSVKDNPMWFCPDHLTSMEAIHKAYEIEQGIYKGE